MKTTENTELSDTQELQSQEQKEQEREKVMLSFKKEYKRDTILLVTSLLIIIVLTLILKSIILGIIALFLSSVTITYIIAFKKIILDEYHEVDTYFVEWGKEYEAFNKENKKE